jgi:nucleolar protein 14
MKGISDDGDSEQKAKKRKVPQADDLDDDFSGAIGKYPTGDGDSDEDEVDDRALEYKDGVLVNKSIFMRKPLPSKDDEDKELGSDDDEEDEDDEDGEDEDDENDDEEDDDDDDDDVDVGSDILSDDGSSKIAGSDEDDEDEEDIDDGEEDDGGEHDVPARFGKKVTSDGKESSVTGQKRKAVDDDSESTIPYTFTAPESHRDLLQHLQNHSPSNQATILHRIRVLYHIKLHPSNKSKLEVISIGCSIFIVPVY